MSSTDPGPFTIAARSLARMLGNSTTWKELTASTIYPPDADFGVFLRSVSDEINRPYAVIQASDQTAFRLVAGGASNWLRQSGSILLYLALDVPAELVNDAIACEFWVLDQFGKIATEITDQSAVDDLLSITNMTQIAFGPPDETDVPSVGLFYFSVWNVQWGDGDT